MVEIWYGIIAFMIIMYALLDGRNFGAGMLHLIVGRDQAERRQIIAAIGPLWVWHEVWLVGFGGTLFVAFPKLLGAAFAGYYLALFLILWCLAFRGIALEAGGHIPDPMWQSFWDVIFTVSNFLLTILFGVALGNLARGVPVNKDGEFSMAFFTNFLTTKDVGLLDWFTLSMAVVVLVFLAAHGATYLALKTEGAVHDRCEKLQRTLWLSLIPLVAIISIETLVVRPELLGAFFHAPAAWFFALVTLVGVGLLSTGISKRDEMRAFLGSGTVLVGLLATGAATIFPVILFSTLDPTFSLTAQNTAASTSSLKLAMLWWPIAAILAFGYLIYMARHYSGKVDVKRDGTNPY